MAAVYSPVRDGRHSLMMRTACASARRRLIGRDIARLNGDGRGLDCVSLGVAGQRLLRCMKVDVGGYIGAKPQIARSCRVWLLEAWQPLAQRSK